MYQSYQRLIYKIAHHFANDPDQFERFLSVGNEAYIRALLYWDGERKFSSYLYRCVFNAIIQEIENEKRAKKYIFDEGPIEDLSLHKSSAEKDLILFDSIKLLSDESKMIVILVFEAPMLIIMNAKSLSQRALRKSLFLLIREMGLSIKKIRKSFREIEHWLNER